MKSYAFIFGAEHTRKDCQEVLDGIAEIPYWYSCMSNCIFFTSSLSAEVLVKRIEGKLPGQSKNYLVTELSDNRQGYLPESAWHLFQHPNTPTLHEARSK